MAQENQDNKIELLKETLRELNTLYQTLEGVAHPHITHKIQELSEKIQTELEPVFKKENEDWDKNWKALEEIKSENKLRSVWSISKVKADDLNSKTPVIEEISYESWGPEQVHKFDKPVKITWLEFWKIADNLIKNSQDDHHIFIEQLAPVKNKPGKFKLITGS